MSTLNVGEKTNVSVPIGQSLTIPATGGKATIVQMPNGGGEPGSPVQIDGTITMTFGPYPALALFRIICTLGMITYSIGPATSPGPGTGIGWQ